MAAIGAHDVSAGDYQPTDDLRIQINAVHAKAEEYLENSKEPAQKYTNMSINLADYKKRLDVDVDFLAAGGYHSPP